MKTDKGPSPEAFILHADGRITELPKREPTLEELQKAVGGYIEVLCIRWLDRPAMLILDEDGKMKGYPRNSKATHTALATAGIAPTDFIVGDVVVLCGPEVMIT
jgi:hypothetical protein